VPIPTLRLAVVAAVLSALVLALPGDWEAQPVLLVVNGALLLVALADSLIGPRPSQVLVKRDLPGVLALGVEGRITWTVGNPSGRAVTVAVADQLAPSLRAGVRRFRVRIPSGGVAESSTAIRPARRGLFTPTDMVVRVDGPLGLGSRQRTQALPGHLRVYPPFRSKDEAELRINKARILEIGLRSAQGLGGGTEFDQLRDYSVDDEFRRVDWSATARVGRPIVRTYRAERNQTVILLLDSGRVMAGRVGGVPRLEHAMDAVMMLTAVATRLGDRCGMVAFDTRVRQVVPPGNRRDQLGRVTEAMYRLEPELAESDYRGAFTETLVRFRRRAMLVILTELTEQAVGEYLLPALPLIVRNHLVVVASVRDPEVAAWAAESPVGAAEAYRKAAAVASLEERRRTTARLRGLGVTVVDAEPGQLAPRLADAYLKVKATGRL
jgi:uncharacterized protein (DUF58 family)